MGAKVCIMSFHHMSPTIHKCLWIQVKAEIWLFSVMARTKNISLSLSDNSPLANITITLSNSNIIVKHKYTTIYGYTSIVNQFPFSLIPFLVQNTHRPFLGGFFYCSNHGRLWQHLLMLQCCSIVKFDFLTNPSIWQSTKQHRAASG